MWHPIQSRAVNKRTCNSWAHLMDPSGYMYGWTSVKLTQFTNTVTSLLRVWRSRLQVNQKLMTALQRFVLKVYLFCYNSCIFIFQQYHTDPKVPHTLLNNLTGSYPMSSAHVLVDALSIPPVAFSFWFCTAFSPAPPTASGSSVSGDTSSSASASPNSWLQHAKEHIVHQAYIMPPVCLFLS